MNPWLIAAGAVALVTKRGRGLAREGAVQGLAVVISVGNAALKTAKATSAGVGHAASNVAGTAAHGASAVVKPFGPIVEEANAEAHGTRRKTAARRPATRRKAIA